MTDRAANDQRHEGKLCAAERAASAAVFDGCDPAEVRARVEKGIAAALEMVARRQAATAGLSVVREVPAQPTRAAADVAEDERQPTSALDALSQWTRRAA